MPTAEQIIQDFLDTADFVPYAWEDWDEVQRLDWITSQILAEDRRQSGVTAHNELNDFLLDAQYERRLAHEVYNLLGYRHDHIDRIGQGIYGRVHVPFDGNPTDPLEFVEEGRVPSQYEKARR